MTPIWRHGLLSSHVQVMVCCLAKLNQYLNLLRYCQLDPLEQTSEIDIKIRKLSFGKINLHISFVTSRPFGNASKCCCSWWRHQIETFSALLALCAGNSPVTGEFPTQRPVTRGFDISFDLRLNKLLNKQSWCWWFETPSCSLWRHCNVRVVILENDSQTQSDNTYLGPQSRHFVKLKKNEVSGFMPENHSNLILITCTSLYSLTWSTFNHISSSQLSW